MLPINKILCPTDFSDASLEALKAAVELAAHFSARLYLVHVVPPIPRPGWAIQFYPAPESYTSELRDYAEALKRSSERKLRETIEKEKAVERTEPIVAEGDAASEIVRIADEHDVDLIVIATHGLSGWRHLLYGSVTEKVLRLASRPVLTIRAPRAR